MSEIWKVITDSDGDYEVSNLGRVMSYKHTTPKIMKQHEINSGYLVVGIALSDGSRVNRLVHRLVAKEFCDGFEDGRVVNHKDANRHNNCAENLEWCTQEENVSDCMVRGTFDIKSAHKIAHLKRRRPVEQLTLEGDRIATFISAREAASVVGVHENNVSRVCRGERKATAGYRFRYLDSR